MSANPVPPTTPSTPSLSVEAALREIETFADLRDDQLAWFAANAQEMRNVPGDVLINEGTPADALFIMLEGEIRGRREHGGDGPGFVGRKGQVIGMLPFSRMTHFPLTARVSVDSRILRVHKDKFQEMLNVMPELVPRLIAVLVDRVKEYSRAEQQRDKLTALGKLSAGLAHELNNPASAAGRAAEALRDCMRELRRVNKALDNEELSCLERSVLASLEDNLVAQMGTEQPLDALERSDLEDELADWLVKHEVADPSKLASGLVEAGVDCDSLTKLGAKFRGEVLSLVLARVVSSLGAERLTREIEGSTGRISELVRAIKEYSYMDQSPEQEVDIHRGIESTLTMMKFQLKQGVEVQREFAPNLPKVFAHGSELNQVWTNLIDNAIDAMGGKGVLKIRTSHEFDSVLVEIIDSGTGIAESAKAYVFDPFFTTKGVGEGTGMGLDTVYRIVRAHHGSVSFESKPGETNFQVRLPLKAK